MRAAVEPGACVTERLYFGKLPCRGDFLRSDRHRPVLQSLDDWMSQTMERLSPDPRWKRVYDEARPLDFAILSLRGSVGLAGHWLASQDASGRRFPFVTASVVHVDAPGDFAALGALALVDEWAHLGQVARQAHAASDESDDNALIQADQALSLREPQHLSVHTSAARLQAFLSQHTVASLEQMLAAPGRRVVLRQAMLALGILLQPVMAQGAHRLNKALCLPLPRDRALRPDVASFWLSLITGFFLRSDAEVAMFMAESPDQPQLLLGFQGASAASLHAAIDPATLASDSVGLEDCEWVEDCLAEDWGLKKLSNYLRDPGLSLQQALDTYREVFMGS